MRAWRLPRPGRRVPDASPEQEREALLPQALRPCRRAAFRWRLVLSSSRPDSPHQLLLTLSFFLIFQLSTFNFQPSASPRPNSFPAARPWRRPTRPECRRFLKRPSASTECRRLCAPITGPRSPRGRWPGYRGSRCGGSSWGSCRNA